MEHWFDGRLKLFLIQKAVCWRREHAQLFHVGRISYHSRRGGRTPKTLLPSSGVTIKNAALIAVPSVDIAALPKRAGARPARHSVEYGLMWKDTEVFLPSDTPLGWKSILSETSIEAEAGAGRLAVKADLLFADFPIAFMHAGESTLAALITLLICPTDR